MPHSIRIRLSGKVGIGAVMREIKKGEKVLRSINNQLFTVSKGDRKLGSAHIQLKWKRPVTDAELRGVMDMIETLAADPGESPVFVLDRPPPLTPADMQRRAECEHAVAEAEAATQAKTRETIKLLAAPGPNTVTVKAFEEVYPSLTGNTLSWPDVESDRRLFKVFVGRNGDEPEDLLLSTSNTSVVIDDESITSFMVGVVKDPYFTGKEFISRDHLSQDLHRV